ncbi:MAG: alpha/beta fold hydrolase [Chloroflexi bacterium]|nr:alpha/beta fold hydrolase [Chloroflexota bacterium]
MARKNIILLHGFASSGNSGKAKFLREKFKDNPDINFHAFDFNPTPKDFEYMTVTGMINRLRQTILSQQLDTVSLLGSSMGGLVGLHYAQQYGNVDNLLLLAPALSYFIRNGEEEAARQVDPAESELFEHYAFGAKIPLRAAIDVDGLLYRKKIAPPLPLVIVHGRSDDVVPIQHSQQYQAQFPDQVRLLAVDSGHRLSDQHDLIWSEISKFH